PGSALASVFARFGLGLGGIALAALTLDESSGASTASVCSPDDCNLASSMSCLLGGGGPKISKLLLFGGGNGALFSGTEGPGAAGCIGSALAARAMSSRALRSASC